MVRNLVVVLLAVARGASYGQLPTAATQPAGPVGTTTATLNGMAVAKGSAATTWFQWGADATYGNVTVSTNIGSGIKVVRVGVPLTGLTVGSVYHYRLVCSNASGMVSGADTLLTTGTKVSTWTDGAVPFPPIPTGLTNIVAQACGHGHSLAIRSDGTVVAWAIPPYWYADYGQATVPGGLSNVVAVAGGWVHSLALKQDGTVSVWGEYLTSGADDGPAYVPANLANVVAVAGGDDFSLALISDGSVVGWGSISTAHVTGLTNIVAISAGSEHALALRADGQVLLMGSESFGTQTPPTGLSNVVAVSTETWHNLALRANGTVIAWGYNNYGQTNVPSGLSNVVAIAAGMKQSLALKADGTLVAWGNPAYINYLPSALNDVVAISSGDEHSLAISPVNLAPYAYSRVASGPMNADTIISLAGYDPNGDSITFKISTPPTNGLLYQFAGSGRGALITSPNTPLTDPSRVIFAPKPNSFSASYDTFQFVANDGQLDSFPATLSVSIVPPPQVQALGYNQGSNAGFGLSFLGLSNTYYSLMTSTDLLHWSSLANLGESASGQYSYVDASATNAPRRFYRVVSP